MADEKAVQTEPKLNPAVCTFCGEDKYPYRIQSASHPSVSICFPCCHEIIGILLVTTADLSAEKKKREGADKKAPSAGEATEQPKPEEQKS